MPNIKTPDPFSKVAWRLIPFMWLLYFVAFLDRVNVSFAALRMNGDLGLSATAYGAGAGVFLLGYVVFEVPSNLALARVGARVWIARIMVTWGIASAAMALTRGPVSFAALRFLLGVAEAGFFPGMILYLTYWFPAARRGRIVAAFMLAIPLSSALGSPISTSLLDVHALGLHGWQWLFIAEGVPAIVLGVATFFFLTDKPENAKWLTDEERRELLDLLHPAPGAGHPAPAPSTRHQAPSTLWHPLTWLLGAVYLGIVIALYGLGFFLPQIVKGFGERSDLAVGLLTMIPYACAAAAMYVWGRHSDATGERRWHVALASGAAAIGLVAAAAAGHAPLAALIALTVASIGVHAALPTFWAFATGTMPGGPDAAGIALVNSVGNLGGYVGPFLLGYLRDRSPTYASGFFALALCIAAAGLLAVRLKPDTTGI